LLPARQPDTSSLKTSFLQAFQHLWLGMKMNGMSGRLWGIPSCTLSYAGQDTFKLGARANQTTTIFVVLKCIVTQQLLPFAASAPSPGAKVQAN
jgi:hypothetical protein